MLKLITDPCKRLFLTGLLLSVLAVPTMASAATASKSTKSTTATSNASSSSQSSLQNQAVTQGYGATSDIQKGMIVQLSDTNPNNVTALTLDNVAKMQGVVVAANDAAVTLSGDANANQVFVATFGRYQVLVSNQNGPIKSGDYITISSLSGIGMEVDTTESAVLGKAAGDFSGTANVVGTAKLKEGSGSVTVSLGMIPVDISISHNPLQQVDTKGLPPFLTTLAQNIAGKPVNPVRVYLGIVVLIISALVSGSMLFSGIRGGLIAIGRNPLAKKQIVAGIVRVVLSGVIIFIIGVFGVYLLVKL